MSFTNKLGLLSLALAITLITGCAARKLSYQEQQVRSVSDTSKCRYITSLTVDTQAYNQMPYLKSETLRSGGDSYKIITNNNINLVGVASIQTSFEVYSCRG